MIYGRGGHPVTIKRLAVLSDIRALDFREPDKRDRDALESGSYVVVHVKYKRFDEADLLYHLAFLRADGGSREITAAIHATMSQHCAVTEDHEHCPHENTLGTYPCLCPCHEGQKS
jgi:hypothetical protein